MGATGTDVESSSEPNTKRRRGEKTVSGAEGTAAESSTCPSKLKRCAEKMASGTAAESYCHFRG
jgi:hypothetical protein